MSTLRERIAQETAEWEERSGRHKRRIAQEKTVDLDDDIRRQIILGGCILEFFRRL